MSSGSNAFTSPSRLIGPVRSLATKAAQVAATPGSPAPLAAATAAGATTAASSAKAAGATAAAAVIAAAASSQGWSAQGIYEKVRATMFANEKVVAAATFGYFVYVVLGGVSHDLHRHIYTGDENESVFTRLKKGKPVVFRREVYEEFFSFADYFTTYQVHVLTAGAWLLSGAYNLRNPPEFTKMENGKAIYDGWAHARLSGYIYVVTSFVKGLTASLLSLRSHSLGWARYPMVLYGLYDCVSLGIAMRYILQGNVKEHKAWMIRNFAVGAGSIWVRVFGAVWALFDLDFMKSNDMYRKMNNVILTTGFTQGFLFGEYWLATNPESRKKWEIAQVLNVVFTIIGAINVYRELRQEREKAKSQEGLNRKLQF